MTKPEQDGDVVIVPVGASQSREPADTKLVGPP